MARQGRLGDKAWAVADAHGCPGCPHPALGPAISGSTNVNVNGRAALRVDDRGVHAACCGPSRWRAAQGSATVFINGRAAHRMGDTSQHCGGNGWLIEGSKDVLVGDRGQAPAGVAAAAHLAPGVPGETEPAAHARPTQGADTAAPARAEEARTWIAVTLLDLDGRPVPWARYRVAPTQGQVREGRLDQRGEVRLDGLSPGSCQVTFPDLNADDWERIP